MRITSAGELCGTGFIVSVASETIKGKRWAYLLTAHHVIANQADVAVEVPDPLVYGALYDPVSVDDWRQPLLKGDLAVAPFPDDPERRFHGIHLETAVMPDNIVPALGTVIHYIGIFAPLSVPMVRAGNLAAMAVPVDKGKYSYQAHLVDCRSYGGFSGSPCFAQLSYAVLDEPAKLPMPAPKRADGSSPTFAPLGYFAWLCGMFTAHYSDETTADGVVSRYGVGVMMHPNEIRAALMAPEQRAERRKWDDEHTSAKEAAMPPVEDAGGMLSDVVETDRDEGDEFERFENLTRQLVQTPKPAAG
ncbi:MAG: trypsin-like peptidase domain-containing protein [Solirubrobacteraceae bacterium]